VVRAAALTLGEVQDVEAVKAVEAALSRAYFAETRRDLALAAAMLGSTAGIPVLLEGLDHQDDLIRESFFESFFAVTGRHLGYDPLMPRAERLEAIAALQAAWAAEGGADKLRRPPRCDPVARARAGHLVEELDSPRGADAKAELIAMGDDAVPALVLGLKFPPGFSVRRALICECLGSIGSTEAAPALAAVLRDPVLAVSAWACWALEQVRDPATLRALQRYQDRVLSLAAAGRIPAEVGPVDRLLMQAARSRLMLGDESARRDLEPLLLSDDQYTRAQTSDALAR
jgi:HEAT repeat protein